MNFGLLMEYIVLGIAAVPLAAAAVEAALFIRERRKEKKRNGRK